MLEIMYLYFEVLIMEETFATSIYCQDLIECVCVGSSTNHKHAIEDSAPSKASNQRNKDRYITNLIHPLVDSIYPKLMISSTYHSSHCQYNYANLRQFCMDF